mmetsp:Transcript_55233/g.159971  ORF Transcript_55233/g.159971 Transcript_55233/m.159971 type:complete len:223 (+) Transcript_55233:143-811(+)
MLRRRTMASHSLGAVAPADCEEGLALELGRGPSRPPRARPVASQGRGNGGGPAEFHTDLPRGAVGLAEPFPEHEPGTCLEHQARRGERGGQGELPLGADGSLYLGRLGVVARGPTGLNMRRHLGEVAVSQHAESRVRRGGDHGVRAARGASEVRRLEAGSPCRGARCEAGGGGGAQADAEGACEVQGSAPGVADEIPGPGRHDPVADEREQRVAQQGVRPER